MSDAESNHLNYARPSAMDEVSLAQRIIGSEVPKSEQYAKLQPLLGDELCRRLGIFPIPAGLRLTVVIPVYNEVRTLATLVEKVQQCGLPCEIILVDDGSTDGTRDLILGWRDNPATAPAAVLAKHPPCELRVLLHEHNRGKGAAVRTGMAAATGQAIIIQDADLEYDPRDYGALWQPVLEDRADIVYGSRFSGASGPVLAAWHTWMNQFITWCTRLRINRRLSDVETCYKLIRRETLQKVLADLREDRFGIEIELTIKLARLADVRFFECPIQYQGRSYSEGKKITWRDGLWALWCLVKY